MGLTDVHGKVLEWCEDWYDQKFYALSPKDDPECRNGEQKYRVVRGGSCGLFAMYSRAAARRRSVPVFRDGCRGFRVVFCPE